MKQFIKLCDIPWRPIWDEALFARMDELEKNKVSREEIHKIIKKEFNRDIQFNIP